MALLDLKNKRTLAIEGRAPFQKICWNRIATPCVHDWAPWGVARQVREST
jgi:hypothetical protein